MISFINPWVGITSGEIFGFKIPWGIFIVFSIEIIRKYWVTRDKKHSSFMLNFDLVMITSFKFWELSLPI